MKVNLFVTIGPMFFLVLWFALSTANIFNDTLLPGPINTLVSFVKLTGTPDIWRDVGYTTLRVSSSFALSIIFGVPLGLLLGSSKKIYKSFEFIIDFLRSMPATAIFPVFMLFFGINDSSKIAVAVFASVLVIIFNTAHGTLNGSKARILVAKTMGATRIKIFKSILFWESLPQTFAGLRTALNFCLILIVLTEMFIGTNIGLGRKIIDFQITYETTSMYAMVIIAGIIGYLLNVLFIQAEKRLLHWKNI